MSRPAVIGLWQPVEPELIVRGTLVSEKKIFKRLTEYLG